MSGWLRAHGLGHLERKRTLKGSYTVEASLIMPLVLFVIFGAMKMGIGLCSEARTSSAYRKELQDLKGAEIFRNIENLESIWRELYGD